MPVLIDINSRDHPLFRGQKNDGRAKVFSGQCINIGLINNMPDSALISTERQLFDLLDAAAGRLPVRLSFYALPMVPRTDWGQQYTDRFYSDNEDLWDDDLDGLIVTGAEPKASNLQEEPYWHSFGRVIDWASENTLSTIWSCLAVHGAVLHVDGIGRHQLDEKCIGVFDETKMMDHPLTEGVPAQLRLPHSRWNEVRAEALSASGYSILSQSNDAGVDIFVKKQKSSLFVYFQGHPEYEAQSLLGEYRRDVGRFLRREIDYYPTLPKGYFEERAEKSLIDFQSRARSDRRHELLSSFPTEYVAANLRNTWRSVALRIFRNWILNMSTQKTRRLKRFAQLP